MADIIDRNIKMFDVVSYAKSKSKSEEDSEVKREFPITRYANVLGAPHMVTMSTVKDAFPDEYLLLDMGTIALSEAEYNACFGDLTTS